MPRGDQLARQWRLLQLIDRPSGITADDAAQELGYTRRTIFRDLRVLQDAGFPIFTERAADGHRSAWKVLQDFKLKLPLKMTLAEVVALVMSRELLAPLGAGALGPAVTSAFDKVAAVLSKDARDLIARMRETVGVRAFGAKLNAPAADLLPPIQAALIDRRSLRITYFSFSRGEESERVVDPYHLTFFNGGLYLVAYCHTRKAVRIFAVERVRKVASLRDRFTIPADFNLEKYLNGAWGIIRGDLVTVKVVFAKPLARYIKERLWHPSQSFRDLEDGRLEMTLRVADTLEVRRWILGYGVQAEVIEPASLREALRAEADAIARYLKPARRPLATAQVRAPRAATAGH